MNNHESSVKSRDRISVAAATNSTVNVSELKENNEMEPLQPNNRYQLPSSHFENDPNTITTSHYGEDFVDTDAIDLTRLENIAVPATYLCVGLLQGLMSPFLNIYPRFLGASEAQQTSVSAIRDIPAISKIVFGFISDNFPIFGFRRKSYMAIGWIISSLSMFSLVMFSDVGRVEDEYGNKAPAENAPSIPFLSVSILLFSMGLWFADVTGDSIVAEKAKLEPHSRRGQLQSNCYACRFFGIMVAAPVSTVVYSSCGPQFVVALMAVIPLLTLPFIYYFSEIKNINLDSISDQCNMIWGTVCSRAVWQPMGFVSFNFHL